VGLAEKYNDSIFQEGLEIRRKNIFKEEEIKNTYCVFGVLLFLLWILIKNLQ